MSVHVKFTLQGMDGLSAKLKRLAAVGEALTVANGETAAEIVSLAKSMVPFKSGKLRDSIVATPPGGTTPSYGQGIKNVPKGDWAVTVGNSRTRYGHLVEYGSKGHVNQGSRPGTWNPGAPAQPFFWPAVRIGQQHHKRRVTDALNKALKG